MKKIIGIGLFSLSLLLVSCGSAFNTDSQTENSSATLEKTENIVNTKADCMKGCITLWKSNTNNKDKTEENINKDCNDLCEAGQGIQNDDLTSCDKSDGTMKDICYSKIAKTKKDPTICEKVTSKMFKNTCYVDVAEVKGDQSLCDKVTEKYMKEVCTDKFIQKK